MIAYQHKIDFAISLLVKDCSQQTIVKDNVWKIK